MTPFSVNQLVVDMATDETLLQKYEWLVKIYVSM